VHTIICLSLDFSHKGFYKRDVKDMIYDESVSPILSHCIIGVFHSISRMETFIFSTGFLKDYKSTLLIFSHRVFEGVLTSKIHIFKCTRGSVMKHGVHLKGHLFIKTTL
jgi:hypothetical protein